MTRVQQIINALAEAKRKPKTGKPADAIAPPPPLMDPKEMDMFVLTSLGYGDMLMLLAYQDKGVYISGSVSRTSHHYSHSHTVSFDLEVSDYYELPENEQAQVEQLANKVQEQVAEEVVDVSDKIYRALERAWDYQISDESIDQDIESNWVEAGHTWDEYGGEDGDLTWEQLDDSAKDKVRERWREGIYRDSDTFWAECIIDDWKAELEEMGFENSEIAWSGFSSQGDGASFTCKSFDLQKYANFFTSGKDKERGHPYTDELFAAEYKREREAEARAAQNQQPPAPPAAESLVSAMLEGDDEMEGYADAAVRNAMDIGVVMDEQPTRYMTGAKTYHWSKQTPDWMHKVSVDVVVFSDQLPDQPWDITIKVTRGAGGWWSLMHCVNSHEEKVQFSINVAQLIPKMDVIVRYYGDSGPESLMAQIEKAFRAQFGSDDRFEGM